MNSEKKNHTLYLCYFGLYEPLVQTQVLPYLREIKKLEGLKVSLLTFETNPKETWTAQQIEKERKKLIAEGISWHFLTYHKTPSAPATLYDVFCGAYFTWKLMRREPVEVLHARSHVPAMMGAIVKRISHRKPKLIFDIRGFIPEEYTDAGRWKENGRLYKLVKRAEERLLKVSDAFVVLTERAQTILFPESRETGFDKFGRPVEVIPCCVDLDGRFQEDRETLRQQTRNEFNLRNRRVFIHLGALGGLYLTEEMADFLAAIRETEPKVFALFLTQSDPNLIISLLEKRGFTKNDYLVRKVLPTDIQRYLNASDAALSFVKATYATASRSPTKIPEYLAGGLPIISNKGVGDVDDLLQTERVGTMLDDFSRASYLKVLPQIQALTAVENFAEHCRTVAERRFDLEKVGGEKYRSLYHRLLNRKKEF